MAEPLSQPPALAVIRPRSAGATAHHSLSTIDVAALDALYALLEENTAEDTRQAAEAVGVAPADLERGIQALFVTLYRELGIRGPRAVLHLAGHELVDLTPDDEPDDLADTPRVVRCESPVCPGPHDEYGRHPAGWPV